MISSFKNSSSQHNTFLCSSRDLRMRLKFGVVIVWRSVLLRNVDRRYFSLLWFSTNRKSRGGMPYRSWDIIILKIKCIQSSPPLQCALSNALFKMSINLKLYILFLNNIKKNHSMPTTLFPTTELIIQHNLLFFTQEQNDLSLF